MAIRLHVPGPGIVQIQLKQSFELLTHPDSAWRVTMHENGFRWESSAGTLDRQPAKTGWQRFRYWFLSLIPVSSQL